MALSVKQQAKAGALVLAVVAIATAPLTVSAAADTKSTTINATVNSVISMTTSGTVAFALTPTGSGAASSASDSVSVSTNNAAGYTLTLSNSDATLTLANGANTIAAHAGTFASPTTLGNNSWGYRVDNVGTFGAGPSSAETSVANLAGTWAGVPAFASPQQLKSTSSTATNDATTVWYGVKADTSKPNGVYTDGVTYTATTK